LIEDKPLVISGVDYAKRAADAKNDRKQNRPGIDWHPEVDAVLMSDNTWLGDGALQYLIGRKDATNGALPADSKPLVAHFEDVYHTHTHPDADFGVHVRYLPRVRNHESLLRYDDIFIVELSEYASFGLAFFDDERLDAKGMWLLPEHRIRRGGNHQRNLLHWMQSAWDSSEPKYAVCEELRL
jgi:hypothetical protein